MQQAAENWGISDRRVRILCGQGKISGIIKKGRSYQIPVNAIKPVDGRKNRHKQIPSQFTSMFMNVDSLKCELNQRRPLTSGELKRLREEFLVEYTYNSNAIEGNTLTLQETAMVLEGITIDKKPLKDHLEAVGHRDAFLYIQDLVKDKIPFTEHIIKQIHTLVLMDRPDDRGIYRKIPVRIMEAFHVPPEPVMVPELMENLIKEFSNKKMHPIQPKMEQLLESYNNSKEHIIPRLARFHIEFEGIHPFVDGNGRTGRLLLNLFLMQNNYPPVNVKFTDRKRYYEAFDSYYRDGSTYEMTEMIASYLGEQLKNILSYLEY